MRLISHVAWSYNKHRFLVLVLAPVYYRTYHTKRVAKIICDLLWLYVHIALLPGIILDTMYYRQPLYVNTCYLNAQADKGWAVAVQIFVYDATVFVMLLSYPVIYSPHRKRMR